MDKPIDKAILKKFLENRCTSAELQWVRQWLELPGIDELLHEILTEDWMASADNRKEEEIDDLRMAEWKSRFYKLASAPEKDKRLTTRTLPQIGTRAFLRVAAIWILVIAGLGLGGIWYSGQVRHPLTMAMVEKRNPSGQRSTILLPDSSIIYLGPGSAVRFPDTFQDSTRTIELEGEAFFKVTHDPARSFIVRSGDVQTRVLGTSFKIEAFRRRPVTVSVASGKVSVASFRGKSSLDFRILSILLPGDKISWDPSSGKSLAGHVAVGDLEQWQTGRLAFDHTSLKDIAEQLERWYNVQIRIVNSVSTMESISGVIPPGVSINHAMDVLSVTGHFKYRLRDRNTIEIY